MSSVTISRNELEMTFQKWLEAREKQFEKRKDEILDEHEKDIAKWLSRSWFARKFLFHDPRECNVKSSIRYERHFFDAYYEKEINEIRHFLSSWKSEIVITERHSFIFR